MTVYVNILDTLYPVAYKYSRACQHNSRTTGKLNSTQLLPLLEAGKSNANIFVTQPEEFATIQKQFCLERKRQVPYSTCSRLRPGFDHFP